jgi:hypothetical protein
MAGLLRNFAHAEARFHKYLEQQIQDVEKMNPLNEGFFWCSSIVDSRCVVGSSATVNKSLPAIEASCVIGTF